ncbi:GMC family oxidoreductase [Candidatus Poribacteria bacterium]|nr:GMC family oxidoreductase [Candidatus Poribacteria bacterium]MXY26718.1 GMC family oxidoreductase [Candidatus Poribacteria bacterium]MYK18879.1 GMC family oxidoreductase [Candidatus Poribacteria bacterium]
MNKSQSRISSVLNAARFSQRKKKIEEKEVADVCVIGSGAGGAVVAKELAEAGLSVIILEAGEHHDPTTFGTYEPEMLRRLFWDSGLRSTRDGAIVISQGRGVGGSTVHNLCYAVRPPQVLLDRWGVREIWPYFDQVEQTLGVTQMQETDVNRLNAVIRRGCDRMRWRGGLQRHNRGACVMCGARCLFGCPDSKSIQTEPTRTGKQSMAVTYIPLALAAGARLYSNCVAEKIHVRHKRAVGVSAQLPSGTLYVESRAVVLAAGAINSPQLWLKSGLPNTNRQVGRNLHLHPAIFVGGVFNETIDGHLGIPQSYYIDEFLDLRRSPDSGYLLMPAFGSQMIVAASLPGFGRSHQELMEHYQHIAALLVLLHDRTTGRVSINHKGTPNISYRLQRSDKRVLVEGAINAATLLFAAGAREIVMPYTEHLPIKTEKDLEIVRQRGIAPNDIMMASSHPQGTLRMGEDRHKAVVKLSGESHAVPGLFVADASLFPTSIGIPPTLTVAALGRHVAGQIIESGIAE